MFSTFVSNSSTTVLYTKIVLAFSARLDDTPPMVAMPCVFGSSSVVRGRSCRLFGVGHSALKFESHPLALDPARLASWRLFPALPPLPDFSFLLSKFQLSLGVFGALVVDFRFQFSKLARAARTFRLPLYPPSKNESGKEKVKFFDLYQALTEVEPRGGKEKGSVKVFLPGGGKVPGLFRIPLFALRFALAFGPCGSHFPPSDL